MPATAELDTRTIRDMGKKKPTGGKHKTERVNIGMPEPWHAVARRLAAKQKQPVIYLLIALLEREAREQGITDVPPPPWDGADE